MRACSHAGVQCDPAYVAAHHFGDHAAVMRFAGGTNAVHSLGRNRNSGVKTESVVGGAQIVINGLGNTDDGQTRIRQTLGTGKSAFTADGDNGVNPVAFHHNFDVFGSAVRPVERVGARGADNSAAAGRQTAYLLPRKVHEVAFDYATPPVTKTDEFVAVLLDTVENCAADNGVETGAVASGGKQTDFHDGSLCLRVLGVLRVGKNMVSASVVQWMRELGRPSS